MRTVCRIATLIFLMVVVSAYAFSQKSDARRLVTTTQNLVRGVIGPPTNNANWSNWSVFNLVPGAELFPITSSTTAFYFGFTAGTEADIGNMVVYTTARGSLTITASTPVTLGGVSNPSIMLNNTSVCPVAPTTTTPCIVRFDPTTISLSPASDYYFVVYFSTGSNNAAISATQASVSQCSLAGTYFSGTDYTHIAVGGSIPGVVTGGPTFLMYVMNN